MEALFIKKNEQRCIRSVILIDTGMALLEHYVKLCFFCLPQIFFLLIFFHLHVSFVHSNEHVLGSSSSSVMKMGRNKNSSASSTMFMFLPFSIPVHCSKMKPRQVRIVAYLELVLKLTATKERKDTVKGRCVLCPPFLCCHYFAC